MTRCGRGLLPAGAYLLLHLLEADLVTPFVLGRRYTLNPVVIFVSLMFFAWLWGVTGALLAVPLLVTAQAVATVIAVLSSWGDSFRAERGNPDIHRQSLRHLFDLRWLMPPKIQAQPNPSARLP